MYLLFPSKFNYLTYILFNSNYQPTIALNGLNPTKIKRIDVLPENIENQIEDSGSNPFQTIVVRLVRKCCLIYNLIWIYELSISLVLH